MLLNNVQNLEFCLFITCLLLGCNANLETEYKDDFTKIFAVVNGAPLMPPLENSLILEVNSSVVLRCEGSEAITWKLPTKEIDFELVPFVPLDPKRGYGIELRLYNVTYKYVGSYFCIKNRSVPNVEPKRHDNLDELAKRFQASYIYIYVNDTEHLLVDIDYEWIIANKLKDVIIPCKPTMPNVEVLLETTEDDVSFERRNELRLIKNSTQIQHKGESFLPISREINYDPKLGFLLQTVYINDILFKCFINDKDNKYIYLKTYRHHYVSHRLEIKSTAQGHVYENGTFELSCSITMNKYETFNFNWKTPISEDDSRLNITETLWSLKDEMRSSNLIVRNAKLTDSGTYICKVSDDFDNIRSRTYNMVVLKPNSGYINMSQPYDEYNIAANANEEILLDVQFSGYPRPTLKWYKPGGELISPSHKYIIDTKASSSTLQINSTQLIDSGEYTVEADNGEVRKNLKFDVTVRDRPSGNVQDVYVQEGQEAEIICEIIAHPTPQVEWTFTPCTIQPRWPSCDKNPESVLNTTRIEKGARMIDYKHYLRYTPIKPGVIRCIAKNTLGTGKDGLAHIFIGDITDNMTVYGVDENKKIARDDEVNITCAALVYFYNDDLAWFKDGEILQSNNDLVLSTVYSNYSFKKTIHFKSIKDIDGGRYECRVSSIKDPHAKSSKFIDIFVHEPSAPVLAQTNLNSDSPFEVKLGSRLELECKATAIPYANVRWYRDDVKLNCNEKENIDIIEENTKLIIKNILPCVEGLYKCIASNRIGDIEASRSIQIIDLPDSGIGLAWILGIVSFIALLLMLIVYLCVRGHKERKLLRELRAAGLENFEYGAVDQINPALSLDEQADLLPYDRNFEFPRTKLKLGKQLGAGAFGVVLKGYAEGIKSNERETEVAVKMVKRTADNVVMRALVSELKIMIHLGQHLNVVNLLGAVTKNIVKKELMVIVEFCRFGNVQNVLMKNRKNFVNQINPETDKIDPNCHTAMTTMTEDDNSSQPDWRSNYKTDSNDAMTLTTCDLISWAFQVARGMDYLSSKRVLHGDLAARNILLCEENVVKICDFGLARTMYNSQNYKKQGEAPLPIKWLALESLSDHVFSTYTDVWSFGIVLWEFFSLAKVPYTGMNPNQNLFLKLKDGYRMEKPPFANDELYDIMLECWSANPESRPLFNVLEKRFARMLGDDITNHYMNLNEPYLRSNNDRQGQSTSFLPDLIASPDEMAPPPPSYVNERFLPEIHSGEQLPTLTNNVDSACNKNLGKDGINPEEMPTPMDKCVENSKEMSNKYSDTPKPTLLNVDDYIDVQPSPQRIITNINNGRVYNALSNPSYLALQTFPK